MNNIFKIIWNKTTQRLEVVSELAKGAVKASSSTQTKTVITKQLFKLTVLSVCLNYSNLSIAAEKIIVNGINFNDKSIAIGGDGGDDRNQKGVQVGNYAGIPGNKQIAIGHDHIVAAGNNSILIGSNYNSRPGGTTGVNTIAIGPGAQAIGRNKQIAVAVVAIMAMMMLFFLVHIQESALKGKVKLKQMRNLKPLRKHILMLS